MTLDTSWRPNLTCPFRVTAVLKRIAVAGYLRVILIINNDERNRQLLILFLIEEEHSSARPIKTSTLHQRCYRKSRTYLMTGVVLLDWGCFIYLSRNLYIQVVRYHQMNTIQHITPEMRITLWPSTVGTNRRGNCCSAEKWHWRKVMKVVT